MIREIFIHGIVLGSFFRVKKIVFLFSKRSVSSFIENFNGIDFYSNDILNYKTKILTELISIKINSNYIDENFIVDFDGVQIVNLNYDIVQNIFNNNSAVYWGFTATTGGSFNNQSIRFTNTSSFVPISDLVICENDTVTINTPVSTNTYLWSPDTFIDNNTSATPNFNPTTTTTYKKKKKEEDEEI